MMKARQDRVGARLRNRSFSRIHFPRRAPSRVKKPFRPPSQNPGTGVGVSVKTGLDSRVRGNGTFKAATASLALIMALLVAACASSKPTPVSAPTATPSPAPAVQTWSESAETGRSVFADRCATCHGDQGQGLVGPPLLGPSSHLEKFSTVQGLLDFISLAMPQDAPGSLSRQEYQGVMAFLLVQNNLVPPQAALEPVHFEHTLLR